MVAAAVIGGAVIGAGASAYSANKAEDASEASAAASREGASIQDRQFQQSRQDLAPYRSIGVQALNRLGGLYGFTPYDERSDRLAKYEDQFKGFNPLSTETLDQIDQLRAGGNGLSGTINATQQALALNPGGDYLRDPQGYRARLAEYQEYQKLKNEAPRPSGPTGLAAFEASPDYQFRLEEGNRQIQRGAAARGALGSGGAQRELVRYGSGLASSEYGNYFNRLAALAGIGQSATNQTGAFGASSAANQGQFMQNAGDARASGYIGRANALNQGVNSIGSAFGQYAQFSGGGGPQTQPYTETYGGNTLNGGGHFVRP